MKKEWNIENLMKLGWQFCDSRIFFTALELRLFDTILNEWKSAEEIAETLGTNLRGTTILLNALAALGFLNKDNGKYRINEQLAKFIDPKSSNCARGILEHMVHLWESWNNLSPVVKGDLKIQEISVLSMEGDRLKTFIQAMDVVARSRADSIVKAVNPGEAKKLLDVGGASGTYTVAFLKASPKLHATLFDLPDVIEIAREKLQDTEFWPRINLVAGDFYKDPLPEGHDLVFLSAIIHQNSLEQNEEVFKKAYDALIPGGRIVIRDYVMNETKTAPPGGAIFAVNMLVNTPGGNTYSFSEIKNALERSGFKKIRMIQERDDMDSLVEAFK